MNDEVEDYLGDEFEEIDFCDDDLDDDDLEDLYDDY